MRAAGCYGVDRVWYTGERYGYAKKFATDTKKRIDEIPLESLHDLIALKQRNCKLVAVELIDGATPLPFFEHPEDAVYIFGPEDGSLKQDVLTHCDDVVYIPTKGCMNLAATVNVVLYDRAAKSSKTDYSREHILNNRDTNNRAKRLR
ncbi:RNA methyltransferase, TrmH family [Pseudoalteromonas luteoviolacea B = ATCC 29581]|nr:RNA methyltransferase, TrmH family [Pseudoalteromonas luteoviolacea B = ATCC 29581]